MTLHSPALKHAGRCQTKLPRSAVVLRAVAAPTRPVKSAVPELLDGRSKEQSMNFQEYTQATQMLNRLKGQASDLEVLLDQLNELEASLDDKILAPPPLVDEAAARQAKRAAKRAERKAQSASVATAEPATASADVQSAAAPASAHATPSSRAVAHSSNAIASSSGQNDLMQLLQESVQPQPSATVAVPEGPSSSHSSAGAATEVQHLEELFRLTVSEPELTPASTSLSPSASSAAPVLRPRKASGKLARTTGTTAPTAPPPKPQDPGLDVDSRFEFLTRPAESRSASTLSPAPSSAASSALPTPGVRPGGAGTSFHDDEDDEDAAAAMLYSGPSDDELLALEREVAALGTGLGEEDELLDVPGRGRSASASAGARVLEASALFARAPEQVSVSAAGPSLLNLLPASAHAAGRGAHSRQARRSARNGSGRGRAAAGKGETATLSRFSKDGTGQFLGQASALTLTAEREREVTEVCKDFIFLEKVKRQCQKTLHRPPTQEELSAAVGMDVRSFAMRYEAGLQAKEILLKSNYRLVMTICRNYMGKGMAVQDLVSEGVKGLLRGVELYDSTKGYRFVTYAHWWIRQAVSRSMAETGRGVRLPNHMIEQLSRLKNVTNQLANALNREPTIEEISEASKLSPARIEVLLESARRNTSLDTAIGDENGQTLKDSLQDERGTADEEFGESSLDGDLAAVLDRLPPREAKVLRLRFGLDDGVERTLEDVGDRLGVTRERIRQMEAKALRVLQMRAATKEDGKLRDYSGNLGMLESKDLAARSSLGTKKT